MTTIFLVCATSFPDFCSMVYQPLRSRLLSRETQPSAPAGGKDSWGAKPSAKPTCGSHSGLVAIGTLALRKLRRFMVYALVLPKQRPPSAEAGGGRVFTSRDSERKSHPEAEVSCIEETPE